MILDCKQSCLQLQSYRKLLKFYFFLHPWKGTAPSEVTTIKTKQTVGYNKNEGYVARTLQE